ncbi:MAG: hypothetical protein AABW51_04350 [Nanoarchaeota archaeon]
MFGILDRLYVNSKKGISHENVDWKPLVLYVGNSSNAWYCFVPKLVLRNKKLREGILPREGKIVVYTLPYLNFIVPDVVKTRDNLR